MLRLLKSIICSKKHTQNIHTATNAKTIVLHCIDFRFIHLIKQNLNIMKLHTNYDEIVLAGSSLHINCNHTDCQYNNTFRDYFHKHVNIAKTLHNISDVIIIEHENCLAYKRLYADYDKNPLQYHRQQLLQFKVWVNNIPDFTGLNFKYYFIGMNGIMTELKLE
jgi:hypothetical protein